MSSSPAIRLQPMNSRSFPNRSLVVLALLVLSLIVFVPEAAATSKLTSSQAKRAVKREIRSQYDVAYYDSLTCARLTRVKMKCHFDVVTDDDVADGNIEGHRGVAYATKYSDGIDVRITSFRKR